MLSKTNIGMRMEVQLVCDMPRRKRRTGRQEELLEMINIVNEYASFQGKLHFQNWETIHVG